MLHHLVESQLVECHGWKSIVHIPSPNLTHIPLIDSNVTGIVKNPFGFSVFYFKLLECILQVLQTSTDLCRQFAAPFKAAYFQED